MRRYGQKHSFGGHASEKIRLAKGVEIASIQVNHQYGVRMHLSDGTSAGELNTRGMSNDEVTTLAPAPGEVIVGFFGKSQRDGFCGVLEFGIITAPKEVGLEGLPDQAWDLSELKNTAGLNGDDDDYQMEGDNQHDDEDEDEDEEDDDDDADEDGKMVH